jgi:protein required for attachment to host cells
MSDYCVVVADGARARFFTLEPAEVPELESGPTLVEREDLVHLEKEMAAKDLYSDLKGGRQRAPAGGPAHSFDDHREDQSNEHDRRFARLVAEQASRLVQEARARHLVVVAQRRTLGLIRDYIAQGMKGVAVYEMAKDVTKLTPLEIQENLAKDGLVPRRKRPGT